MDRENSLFTGNFVVCGHLKAGVIATLHCGSISSENYTRETSV